ncbi:type II toxin-antitoxin system HicB family antitoxin [Arsenicibacter rosenii]|uniref:2-oxoisovalerate dehydrogenase n=1 Tax=Arsenicibacter rosenii TaxID=1750698 RepID=A0A1S2VRW2_9BACT|nr:hypothetical protein [Arsenicibacter rosenii]OIN61016.1 hypothetical protein BLX24_02755 [Arsenicibacter rosenii]
MLTEIIFVVESDKSGGFQAYSLEEGILTQGDTIPELQESIREALDTHYSPASPLPPIRLILPAEVD